MTISLSLTSFAAVAVLLVIVTVLNIEAAGWPLKLVTGIVMWGCLLLLTFMTVALVVSP